MAAATVSVFERGRLACKARLVRVEYIDIMWTAIGIYSGDEYVIQDRSRVRSQRSVTSDQ